MGARRNVSESIDWQKPAAQSKFRCVIIKIGTESGFWKAALRITPCFRPALFRHPNKAKHGHFRPPGPAVSSTTDPDNAETGILWLPSSIH
jgi:hypothetical protein